jgi:alpha-L-rhamnosidase
MNDVKASHESPYGTVSSAWKTVDGNFILELSIPVNTTAEVFVPSTGDVLLEGGKEIPGAVKVEFPGLDYHFLKITTGSGKYTFTSTFLP